MDLQTLSTLDDLLSDVLLDGINLWFQTHKMNKDYRPMRLPSGNILDIIQRKVIVERKVPEAVKDLLEIEAIKKLFKTDKEIQDFNIHARRYLNIYLPTAGFEISQTDRYSAVTNKSEACVIANRPFQVGSELRYCAGTIAILNEQEEKDLESRTSDFSVIKTSRRGTCLFLGPARFVNHDCDPNCSFMSAGTNVIYFKVQKAINVNDEITTHYGDNYFGVNNQECLCATCERHGRGGYKKSKAAVLETPSSPTLNLAQEQAPGRKLRIRSKKLNYRPTLLSRSSRKQTRTPPKTSSPPVETDTIPSTLGPLTPVSQNDTEGAEESEKSVDINNSDVQSASTPTADDRIEGYTELELMLASSMTMLQVSENSDSGTEGQQTKESQNEDITVLPSDHQEGQTSTAATTKTTEHSISPLNFRMSIDFLCHSSGRVMARSVASDCDTADQISRATTPDCDVVQIQHSQDNNNGIVVDRESSTATGQVRCETCKNITPKDEMRLSKSCRRCHRHLSIYGTPWPSRNSHSIVARLKKAEHEAAMKLKAAQNAIEAEKLRKKKAAAEAARRAAKAEMKAKQEQLKAQIKARVAAEKECAKQQPAVHSGQAKSSRKKTSKQQGLQAPYEFHPLMTGFESGLPATSLPCFNSYPYATQNPYDAPSYFMHDSLQQHPGQHVLHAATQPYAALYNGAPAASLTATIQDLTSYDLDGIITEQHPFHHSPYVVFVDPQDGGESSFWWIAVTVPRNQMDPSMPELTVRKDGTIDPDLCVVRFLEDFKYSVCNISGLRLFHPEQEPYRGYVNTLGREFIRNLGVKRALAFLNGDVPSGLPWRHMSCNSQLSLLEVAMYTRRVDALIAQRLFWMQQPPQHQMQQDTSAQ
ncbi:Histone-lysine N-methyltransferase set9, partial [Mortierella claussenii]